MPSSPVRRSRRPAGDSWRVGTAAKAYEAGLLQRTVIIEFDSVEKADAAHDSPAYQEALRVLGKAVDRDMRIVEGVE